MQLPATPYLQVVKGSRDLLVEFWDHLHISGTVHLETSNWARRCKIPYIHDNQ